MISVAYIVIAIALLHLLGIPILRFGCDIALLLIVGTICICYTLYESVHLIIDSILIHFTGYIVPTNVTDTLQ